MKKQFIPVVTFHCIKTTGFLYVRLFLPLK